jgi:hypothetical protein
VTLGLQYLAYLLNLNAGTSPAPFPPGYYAYPKNGGAQQEASVLDFGADLGKQANLKIEHAVPFFFHYKLFRYLEIDYLLGIGIDQDQIESMALDFINLFVVTMYVLNYRNPILVKSMTKVFW